MTRCKINQALLNPIYMSICNWQMLNHYLQKGYHEEQKHSKSEHHSKITTTTHPSPWPPSNRPHSAHQHPPSSRSSIPCPFYFSAMPGYPTTAL